MDETTSEILKSPRRSFDYADVMPTVMSPFSGGYEPIPSEIERFKVPSKGPLPIFFVRDGDGPLELSEIIEFGSGSDVSKGDPPSPWHGICYIHDTDRTSIMVRALRQNLKDNEERFKNQYSYAPPDPAALLHCFDLHQDLGWRYHAISLKEEASSGITWVGVYGIDEMCVVTLSGHLDRKRVRGCLASIDSKTVLSIFRTCVLSELEDLADPSSERQKELNRSLDMPFCAVSTTLPVGSHRGNERPAGTGEYIGSILQGGQMGNIQDSGASIRLAIYVFQLLIKKKCEAEEIEVTVVSGRRHGYPSIKDLDVSEIGDCLASMDQDMKNMLQSL